MDGICRDNCASSQNEDLSRRYCYPQCDKYLKLENNLIFNVVNGRLIECSHTNDFRIYTNEFLAVVINSDAMFNKVCIESSSECFLVPADINDDLTRNFFRTKFEQFHQGEVSDENVLDQNNVNAPEERDFAFEFSERRRFEQEYLTSNGFECEDKGIPK